MMEFHFLCFIALLSSLDPAKFQGLIARAGLRFCSRGNEIPKRGEQHSHVHVHVKSVYCTFSYAFAHVACFCCYTLAHPVYVFTCMLGTREM